MGLTRRSALAMIGAGAVFAQAPVSGFKIGYTAESQGTRIVITPAGRGAWLIGLLSSDESADMASVDVFYMDTDLIANVPLLLHKNSPCPVVRGAMFLTDESFTVPLESVRFIRVTLLQTVAKREFR